MSAYTSTIQKMYVAFFNRPADFNGLLNWEAFAAGKTEAALVSQIAKEFSKAAEYTIVYKGMEPSQIVTKIYNNLLNRDPDMAGLTNWVNHLAKGTSTVDSLVTDILTVAGADDLKTINNKVTAATAFTSALDTVAEANAYSGAAANAVAAQWLAAVGTDASLAAATTPAALTAVTANVLSNSGNAVGTTFTLTTGVDTTTGTALNDKFNATNATLNTFDTINGGDGVDTLAITDTAAITALNGTITSVEKLVVASASSVGSTGAAAVAAAKGVNTITFAGTGHANGDTYTVTINGVNYTTAAAGGTTPAAAAAAVAAVINAQLGANTATVFGDTVQYVGATVGAAMPVVSVAIAGTTANTVTASAPVVTVAPSNGSAATTAAVFDASGKGFTSVEVKAAASSDIKVEKTADVTIASTGGTVNLDGAKSATVSAVNAVTLKNVAGAVAIDQTKATAVATTATTVEGGTSVSIKQIGATLNATKDTVVTANNAAVTIGAAPAAIAGATASGYPQVIQNLAKDPTGNIDVTQATSYTNTAGLARVAYGTGAVTAYTNGATSATITGGGNVTITDVQTTKLQSSASATAVAGTSTLQNVALHGVSGTVALTSDKLTTLKVTDAAATTAVTITNDTVGGHALELTVANNAAGASVTDAKATSVAISSTTTVNGAQTGSASDLTLSVGEATSLAFYNGEKVTLNAGSTLTKVATVTASGHGTLDLGNLSGLTKLTSIDASAANGSVKVAIGATPTTTGMTVKTGNGADVVTLNGAIGSTTATNGGLVTTTIALGAGNDSLLKGTGSVTAGAAIDAGDGVDTLSASLFTAGNSAVFKNFEILDLGGVADLSQYDASLLTNSTITGVALASTVTGGGATTVSNINGTNLAVNVSGTGTLGSVTATLKTATGTADVGSITFAADGFTTATTSAVTGLTSSGLETVNVVSGGTAAAGSAATVVVVNSIGTLTDTLNATAAINVTGGSAFTLGSYTNATTYTSGIAQNTAATTATADVAAALKTIDGSAATGALTIVAGTSSGAIGGTTFVTKYDGLTIKGGSGNDKLVNTAKAGVVDGGAGDDIIVITGTEATAKGGAGADTIYVSGSKQIVDVGAADGKVDSVVLALAAEYTTTAVTAFGATSALTAVSNLAKGDTINLSAYVATAATADLGKFDASTFTTLQDAVNAAITSTAKAVDFFVWADGNTYVVVDGAAAGGNNHDAVIKLVGTYDLTTATATAGVVTLG